MYVAAIRTTRHWEYSNTVFYLKLGCYAVLRAMPSKNKNVYDKTNFNRPGKTMVVSRESRGTFVPSVRIHSICEDVKHGFSFIIPAIRKIFAIA